MSGHKNKKELPYLFHPYEIAFIGFSGTGKTTLIRRLLERWEDYKISYVKHDAHRFFMDTPGKDTHLAYTAGASQVSINDPDHRALVGKQFPPKNLEYLDHLHFDFTLIEGYKNSSLPKMLFIDPTCSILAEEIPKNLLATISSHDENPAPHLGVPWFHRGDLEGISNFVLEFFKSRIPPIKGLVLGGGFSSRMGKDKNSIEYQGQSLRDRALELLKPYCDEVYWSVRDLQQVEKGLACIPDSFLGLGPLSGILSAQRLHPTSSFLVLACDLPAVQAEQIEHLIAQRNPFKIATAYLSQSDGKSEPLCALWEPHSFTLALQTLARGFACPRYILGSGNTHLIENPFPGSLDNANTPEDFKRITGAEP